MTFRETLALAWQQFSVKQKLIITTLSLAIGLSFLIGGINFISAWREVRQMEAEARRSKSEADSAMKRASEIAQEILKLEPELKKLEEQRNARQIELETASKESRDAVADVNRARREPRADRPSAAKLCAELAELGYPCR